MTKQLSSNLKAIRAILRDAERKQITSYAVKDWLQKLTDAAYVFDDILDECSIHSTKMHSVDAHTSCLSRLQPKDILFRFHIEKRMKDITQRFHNIHEERLTFELRVGVTEKQTVNDDDDDWHQTSSVITEPIFCGRDKDREKIVKFLLEDASNSEDFSIYPIVGMGGLGKTILAKQVFNDHEISKKFKLRIWICVSENFNVKRILQSIIECTIGQNPNLSDLEARLKKVEEALQNKRYLLVLDDVWNENTEKWKELKGMLECARGTKGATILVTTRLEEVVSIMGTHSAYRLKALSEDDSWSLFKHHAFGPNREEREEFVTIGKEIMRKRVGSPLAIKTLTSRLHDESESIMGEECVVIETSSRTLLSARVHYSSFLESGISFDLTDFKPGLISTFKKVESMRTFLDFGCTGMVPLNHYLRALCLRSSPLFSPFKDLVHLRHLSLHFSLQRSLDNLIGQMPKLQILKLTSCPFLELLPKTLTQLQDLRHVMIDKCASIVELPPNISKLRYLRTLGIFVSGSKPGCGLRELHRLNLGGTLKIKGLENVPNERNAKQANFIGKKDLNILHLSLGGKANSEGNYVSVERVLEALEPPSTLKSFGMNGY
ncbi:hypothetical protein V8G54_015132 [Vigna mungo]|uniref:Disease resistance protein RGA3 n=1 Tax=Vigna mungo TaxID=3915 RepID=A0AAQ3NJP2_VIGMU